MARVGPDARIEFFPLDRRADALALLDEWAAPEARALVVENRVTRTLDEFGQHLRHGDRASAGALVTDDFTAQDRRRGVSAPDLSGREEFIASLTVAGDVFGTVDHVPAAVRGERLALVHWALRSDGFETTGYDVFETDASGRVCRCVTFDPERLVDALEELDRGDRAIRVVPEVESCVLGAYGALNRRDWPAFEDHLDAELSVVDHRTLGFPPGRGGASLSRELQMLVAQVPDVVAYPTRIESRGDVALVTTHQTGTAAAGGGASWDFLTVVALASRSGRIGVNEYFDADDVAGARRRFEAVARELEASPATDNRCVRVVDQAFARHRRGEDVTDVFGAVGDPMPGATVEHLATRGGHAGARPVAGR